MRMSACIGLKTGVGTIIGGLLLCREEKPVHRVQDTMIISSVVSLGWIKTFLLQIMITQQKIIPGQKVLPL